MLSNYEILTIKNDGLKYEVQKLLDLMKEVQELENHKDILDLILQEFKEEEAIEDILEAVKEIQDKDSFFRDTALRYIIIKIEKELRS